MRCRCAHPRRAMCSCRGWRWGSLPAAGLVLLCALAPAASLGAAGRPTAQTLLRRADLVRNPFLGISVDLELSVVSSRSGRRLRRTRYTMLTHRAGRTLMLIHPEEEAVPGALLLAGDTYQLLLPRLEQPVALALRHVVHGDLSHAGFLRVDLRRRFVPRHAGTATIDGVPCHRLELEPRTGAGSERLPFARVTYWVAREGFLPVRIEFRDAAGELLKRARFTAYQETGVGRRPARIVVEDTRRPGERATLSLGKPRGVPTSRLEFDIGDLVALRAAGRRLLATGDGRVRGRELVYALLAAAQRRSPGR